MLRIIVDITDDDTEPGVVQRIIAVQRGNEVLYTLVSPAVAPGMRKLRGNSAAMVADSIRELIYSEISD